MNTKSIVQKKSAGGIIYSHGKFLVLSVTRFGEIVFPKGTIEKNEAPEQAAMREVLEETGYHTKIIKYLGDIAYEYTSYKKERCYKTVDFFLLALIDENEQPKPNLEPHEAAEGIENLWLTKDEALDRLTHENSKEMLEKAVALLRQLGYSYTLS